jgi:hypothetical protein
MDLAVYVVSGQSARLMSEEGRELRPQGASRAWEDALPS